MGSQKRSFLPRKRDLKTLVAHWEHADFGKKFPALYELLVAAKDGDQYRAGSRFTLFCEDGRLKASLWDPATQSVWFATLDDTEDPLGAVEALLQAGRGEWRDKRAK